MSEGMGLRGQCGCCVSHLCGYIAASRDWKAIASCLGIEYKVGDSASLHLFAKHHIYIEPEALGIRQLQLKTARSLDVISKHKNNQSQSAIRSQPDPR